MLTLFAASAFAAVLSVGPAQPYPTLGSALAVAQAGDTIEVDPGTYNEQVTVSVAVDLVGTGGSAATYLTAPSGAAVMTVLADATVTGFDIDGSGVRRGLSVDATRVTLDDLHVHDGYRRSDEGACVHQKSGDLIVRNSLLERCDAGGIDSAVGARLWVRDTTIQDSTGSNGGAILARGPLVVQDSSFLRNLAYNFGGALYVDYNAAAFTVTGSTFDGNETQYYNGGAVYADVFAGNLKTNVVSANRFVDNHAGGSGGAVQLRGPTTDFAATALVSHNLFAGNSTGGSTVAGSADGGAVAVIGSGQSCFGCLPVKWAPAIAGNTFVGNEVAPGAAQTGRGSHVYLEYTAEKLYDDVFVGGIGAEAVAAENLTGARDYDLVFDNAVGHAGGALTVADLGGHTLVDVDPAFVAYSDDGDWTNDDFRPAAGSPLIDAGSPLAPRDPDGSPADLGAFLP